MSDIPSAPGLPRSFDIMSAGDATATRAAWEAQFQSELMRAIAEFLRAVEREVGDVVRNPAAESLLAAGPDTGPDAGGGGLFSLGRVFALWQPVAAAAVRLAADLTGREVSDPEIQAILSGLMASRLPTMAYDTAKAILSVAGLARWPRKQTLDTLSEALQARGGAPLRLDWVDEDPLRGLNIDAKLVRLAEWTEQVRGEARTAATQNYNRLLYDTIANHGEPLTKRWVSHHDEKVRASHLAANGQRVQLHSAFMVGGFALLYPGDPGAPPQERMRCRCVMTAWPVDSSLP